MVARQAEGRQAGSLAVSPFAWSRKMVAVGIAVGLVN